MKNKLLNSIFIVVAAFVMILSVNISLIQDCCSSYVSCVIEDVNSQETCCLELEKNICCDKTEKCCSGNNTSSCHAKINMLHFNFETLISCSMKNIKPKEISLFLTIPTINNISILKEISFIFVKPPLLSNPTLSEIQSFLI